ncbi:MAG: adenine phosphoribosyltransferase [Proteobacteria bacterium]|nr:adenine phosphoribosyltransferase [Pseudomonadota bacterium]
MSDNQRLKNLVRTIPNFPKDGIMFRDITTLILDPWGLATTTKLLSEHARGLKPDKIIAIESRGFIFGTVVAHSIGCGVVLARKKGKLPGETVEIIYNLEYGQDCLQIHKDAVRPNERCLIIDDLLATGGTATAAAHLIERMGGQIVGCSFVVNLPELGGAKALDRFNPSWLLDFDGH